MSKSKEIELHNQTKISEVLDEGALELSEVHSDQKKLDFSGFKAGADYVESGEVDVVLTSNMEKFDKEFAQKSKNSNSVFNLFQTAHIKIELYLETDVTKEREVYYLTNDVQYNEADKILEVDGHLIKIPDHTELGITENKIFFNVPPGVARLQPEYQRFIIEYGDGVFKVRYDRYSVDMEKDTNLFIDQQANLAFNYCLELAQINIINDTLKCGRYTVNLLGEEPALAVRGRWIRFSPGIGLDAAKGILKLGKSKIKIPADTYLVSNQNGVDLYLMDKKKKAVKQIHIIYQGERVILRDTKNSIQMKKDANVFIDKKGNFVFEHTGQVGVINFTDRTLKIGQTIINMLQGQSIKVLNSSVQLNEVTKLETVSHQLQFRRNTVHLPNNVKITANFHEVDLEIDNKLVFLIPRHKQLFIRVGGKLVIVTVTMGIAIDGSGNLKFEHSGHLAVLDTSLFVLNLEGAKINFGKTDGVCIEIIGNTVIVSLEEKENNILELFKQQLGQQGFPDIVNQLSGEPMDLAALIELILSSESPEKLVEMLLNSGIELDPQLLQLLISSLGQDLIEALLSSSGQQLDFNQLMMLSMDPNGIMHLMMSGQTIPLPAGADIVEQVMAGESVANIIAKIKNSEILLESF